MEGRAGQCQLVSRIKTTHLFTEVSCKATGPKQGGVQGMSKSPHRSLFFSVHYFSFERCQKPLRWCAEGGQQGGVLQCLGDRLLLRIGGRGGKGGWRLAPMVRKWALRDGRAGGGRPVEDGSARVIRGEGVRDRLTVDSGGKSARFTLLRVSICRHYGATLVDGRSASPRNGRSKCCPITKPIHYAVRLWAEPSEELSCLISNSRVVALYASPQSPTVPTSAIWAAQPCSISTGETRVRAGRGPGPPGPPLALPQGMLCPPPAAGTSSTPRRPDSVHAGYYLSPTHRRPTDASAQEDTADLSESNTCQASAWSHRGLEHSKLPSPASDNAHIFPPERREAEGESERERH
ncbi:hypothetical protein E1301_Tti019892 [Triplophysa tibetana]|uniref:Uncharacterized protein n=1 Tax=Triplophysa tibetana TaxID=1572043 RepID=A0A5A9PE35_9TELE|nr:hypothetical protein E1301_Tti019892 [Triplophysa tibetana]